MLLGLVGLLQLIEQHRFFLFQQLGLVLRHIRVIFFVFYTVFVGIFKCFLVRDDLVHEMGLGTDLVVLDFLEPHLLVLQVENAILRHHLVDLVLLGLDIVVGAAV